MAAISAAVSIAFSCNLDTTPTDKYTVDIFWDTEKGTEAAMTGCYNILLSSGLFGGATPLLEETATPNAYNYNDNMSFNSIARGTHTAATKGIITSRWEKCYEGIGRCNTHLNRLPGAAVSDQRKTTMEGEAKFLRALYYYMLITYYNDVPLIKDEPEYSHGSLPRTPRATVVESILSDLQDAENLLDWKWTGAENQGRATKGAAMALRARVLLFEASPLLNSAGDKAKWTAAATAAKSLIDKESKSGYDLYGDYRKLFLKENEHSCESVFNVEFSRVGGDVYTNEFNLISVQYRDNAPLLDLVRQYRNDDSKPDTDYSDMDPRFYATIFYPGSTFLGTPGATASQICQFTGFAHKKLTIYDGQAEDPDQKFGDTNYMVLRYADVLLMFAEAQNEVDDTPSNAVYDALNRVRSRAGSTELAYGSLSKNEMREAIRKERRLEFAGEGLYYNDIRRWKTAEIVMNASVKAYDGKDIALRSFDPDRDYWWPIPSDQILLNPKLVQNQGY